VRKLLKSPKTRIEWAAASNEPDFKKLFETSSHDYYLVGPGARGEVPHDLRRNPCIVQLIPQLDPASLEAARIHAGVVI